MPHKQYFEDQKFEFATAFSVKALCQAMLTRPCSLTGQILDNHAALRFRYLPFSRAAVKQLDFKSDALKSFQDVVTLVQYFSVLGHRWIFFEYLLIGQCPMTALSL